MINPDLRRKLKVRVRPDLEFIRQQHGGQTFHVVKDPVALRYYRFREEELFLLKQFDGERNLDDVRHEFVTAFRPQRLSVVELEKFVRQLLHAGLAAADTPQLGQRLYERYKKKRNDRLKQMALQALYLKVPVFDPERLLDRLLPWTRFLFATPFFLTAVAAWLASALLVLMNWDTFVTKLPKIHDLLDWRNLLYLWAAVGVVKVLHEFGHGLACKRFGGEVHEMGFMLLVFSPCLYCNVTDSWMLPNKWHRAVIGAAGMYVEALLAMACVWLWWYSDAGLLHTMTMGLIFVCGVSTVLFNANPLMRFDGYYILSDLLEIPNLRERSNKLLGNVASQWVFGAEAAPDPYKPTRYQWLFAAYAVGAYVYKWVVAVGILYFLYTFLKPYKLEILGHLLAMASLTTLAIVPLYQLQNTLRNRWRTMKVKPRRAAIGLAGAATAVGLALFVPFPMRLDLPMVLQPRAATAVYVQADGILDELRVKDGDVVAPNSELARLRSAEIDKERAKLQRESDRQRDRMQAGLGADDRATAAEANTMLVGLRQQQLRLNEQAARMILRAPRGVSGTVIAPPTPEKTGATLPAGTLFCKIGDPTDLVAYIVVEHSDTALLHKGQRAWVKVAGHVGAIPQSAISDISEMELDDLPQALSNKAGGAVATTPEQAGGKGQGQGGQSQREKPLARSFTVLVPVNNHDGTLVAGVRGTVRVDCGSRSLAWRLTRYLRQTFHFKT